MPSKLPLEVAAIVAMYESGSSELAVAKHFGVCRDTIKRRLYQAGVLRRTAKEAAQLCRLHFPHPRLGKPDPGQSKRMKQRNPVHLPGVPERRAATYAETFRNRPTPGELRFEQALQRIGLCRGRDYEFQLPIGSYVADFAFPHLMLLVEIDGRDHFSRPEARESRRKLFLESLGWRVVRIPCDYRQQGCRSILCGEKRGKAISIIREIAANDNITPADVFG